MRKQVILLGQGNDPAQIRRVERAEMTLDGLHNEYMTRCAVFNRRTDKPKANYRLYLSVWGKRKLSTIKHEEVDRLHKKIGRENGIVTANIALKLLHVMFNKATWPSPRRAGRAFWSVQALLIYASMTCAARLAVGKPKPARPWRS
jgi:hypothetical protein